MHFTAFLAAIVWATAVQSAVLQKNPTKESTNLLIAELAESPKNPAKPPDKPLDGLNPWSGAVIPRPPPHAVFNYVSAKFTIPEVRIPKGGKTGVPYGVAGWIGIDGFGGLQPMLQAGVYLYISPEGDVQIIPFYEWVPQDPYSVFIDNFAIRVKDAIAVRVESSAGGTVGVVTIENETTRQIFTKTFKANPASVLVGETVDWIVEKYILESGEPSTPPDFGPFVFTDAVAKTSDGGTYSPVGGGTYGPAEGVVVNYAPMLLPRLDPDGKVTVSYFPG